MGSLGYICVRLQPTHPLPGLLTPPPESYTRNGAVKYTRAVSMPKKKEATDIPYLQ